MKLKCEATGVVVDAPEYAVETLKKAGFLPVKEKKAAKKKAEEAPEEAHEEQQEGE